MRRCVSVLLVLSLLAMMHAVRAKGEPQVLTFGLGLDFLVSDFFKNK